jgi:hypothetical protein
MSVLLFFAGHDVEYHLIGIENVKYCQRNQSFQRKKPFLLDFFQGNVIDM